MLEIDLRQYRSYMNEAAALQMQARKWAACETRGRDQQLAHQRGGLETLLQAVENICSSIRLGEVQHDPSLTEEDLETLAEKFATGAAMMRRVLNQPQGRYNPTPLS